MDLAAFRRNYTKGGLRRRDLNADPFVQFETWFKQALEAGITEPNAFTLATADRFGRPSARTVLLKYFDASGFVFYTNYRSRKAREISENPHVAMLFAWLGLERQVKVTGVAEKVSHADSLKYFMSRPRGSQLGAWVSIQSSVISSRKVLEMKWAEMMRKFKDRQIPIPDYWGGYRIIPDSIEFWQGGEHRLHDRFLYTKNEDRQWTIQRLAP